VISLMIIAQQVQGPVQYELTQFSDLAMPEGIALTPGAVEGDHDFTQKESSRGEFISIRERKYIGRSVDAEKPMVQLTNGLVAG